MITYIEGGSLVSSQGIASSHFNPLFSLSYLCYSNVIVIILKTVEFFFWVAY